MHHVFKLKKNRLNNRDFNIDQKIIVNMMLSIIELPYIVWWFALPGLEPRTPGGEVERCINYKD